MRAKEYSVRRYDQTIGKVYRFQRRTRSLKTANKVKSCSIALGLPVVPLRKAQALRALSTLRSLCIRVSHHVLIVSLSYLLLHRLMRLQRNNRVAIRCQQLGAQGSRSFSINCSKVSMERGIEVPYQCNNITTFYRRQVDGFFSAIH